MTAVWRPLQPTTVVSSRISVSLSEPAPLPFAEQGPRQDFSPYHSAEASVSKTAVLALQPRDIFKTKRSKTLFPSNFKPIIVQNRI